MKQIWPINPTFLRYNSVKKKKRIKEFFVWIVLGSEWNSSRCPMGQYQVKNYYQYRKLRFGTLVEVDKNAYLIKARKNYLGWVVKRGENLTLTENFILFDKLRRRIMKNIRKGIDEIGDKKYQLIPTA